MAITKIHPITRTVGKSVKYITNPDKTDGQILITSYACSPQTAEYDFRFSLSQTRTPDERKAFHLIQSFAPGEVTFEEAHKIGIELADQLLHGKYSYIVSTHIDKQHVHNHVIFCASDNVEHRKFRNTKKDYYRIRELSDNLCKEHNLSVIVPGEKTGITHTEWQAKKDGTSWKAKIQDDIDTTISRSSDYKDFIERMRAMGYEIKGESLACESPKYISFRPTGKDRFIRGSAKSLGPEYTKEQIFKRIEVGKEKQIADTSKVTDFSNSSGSADTSTITKSTESIESAESAVSGSFPISARPPKIRPQDPAERFTEKKVPFYERPSTPGKLIDTSQEKFANSPGLKKWAELQNLKTSARSFAEADSIEAAETKLAEKKQKVTDARQQIKALEQEIKQLREIVYYGDLYLANRRYGKHYEKAPDQEDYYRRRASQLELCWHSEEFLKKAGVPLTRGCIEKERERLQGLTEKRDQLSLEYRQGKTEYTEMDKNLKNVKEYVLEEGPEKGTTGIE